MPPVQGRFEIMGMITPWIVRHKAQLLINRIYWYNKFCNKNVFWEFLFSENVNSAYEVLKAVKNIAKEAIKVHIIDVKILRVSNYRYPITNSSNRAPVIGHPRDHAPIMWKIGAQRTNHRWEICYRYD